MFKRQWTWFRNLKPLGKWTVIGGLASLVGLVCTLLPFRNDNQPQQISAPPASTVPSVPPSVHVGSIRVDNQGTGNQSTVNFAARDLNVQKIYPPPDRFVDRVFVKAEADGEAPRILTTTPNNKIARLLASKDPTEALKAMTDDGFFCEPGTEIEVLPDNVEPGSSIEQAVESLYSRVKVLIGPHKDEQGWILKKLLEHKQVRE